MEFTKAVKYLVDVLRVPLVIQLPEQVARPIKKAAFKLPKRDGEKQVSYKVILKGEQQ